jgi:hypothetical protein
VSNEEIDALIAGNLRGDLTALSGNEVSEKSSASFLARVDFHGVAALLDDCVQGHALSPLRRALRDRAIAQFAWELEHCRILSRILASFESHGIKPILLKGTALAYWFYKEPALRARGDTDILVAPHDCKTACSALRNLGFRRAEANGDPISQQTSYILQDGFGQEHEIDLHWEINNSPLLARLLSHEELLERAVPLPRLAPTARGAGLVDAMLIACMHRQKHLKSLYYVEGIPSFGADRLIWIYDIDLLATAFSPEDWNTLAERACEKGLAAVVCGGLLRAGAAFRTCIPDAVLKRLTNRNFVEAPAEYLMAGWLRREWMDMCAREGTREKIRYVVEMAFPPADYMRARFADARPSWLIWLYARRALGGIANRIRAFRAPQ